VTVPLPIPSADTRHLVGAALNGLRRIYRPGFAYAKSGVMLMELMPMQQRERTLFDDEKAIARSAALMQVTDRINRLFGKDTLKLCGEGFDPHWKMRTDHKSPSYTTRLSEIPLARA